MSLCAWSPFKVSITTRELRERKKEGNGSALVGGTMTRFLVRHLADVTWTLRCEFQNRIPAFQRSTVHPFPFYDLRFSIALVTRHLLCFCPKCSPPPFTFLMHKPSQCPPHLMCYYCQFFVPPVILSLCSEPVYPQYLFSSVCTRWKYIKYLTFVHPRSFIVSSTNPPEPR